MAKAPKKPDYSVSVVAERNGKDIWTRVGVAFKNDSEAAPITILLNPGITLTGDSRLVLSVPKAQQDGAEAA